MNHHTRENGERSLAELVSRMNNLMHRSTGAASYVTFFYAQFDEMMRTLTYVNAGHNPPMLVRGNHLQKLDSTFSFQKHTDNSPGSFTANGITARCA